ncbi:Protein eva-1-like C [Holothuria leucospilota]|uniref:Protein eva-1-like C n=1 Tax=Holothuria leucospilota TaxID=206669 RepID=A0A9Q1BIL9_HOLLE|nr:Protein eva-1-like C [Holothuria leucospilota]
MCPYRWTAGVANDTSVIIPKSEDTNCRAAESLQILISNCQNEEKCTLRVTNEVFGEDPCPGTHKYLDVTYKCRPNDFKSLVVCEHRHMQLYCEGANIIAIYSASFGRTELGSMECPSYTMHEIGNVTSLFIYANRSCDVYKYYIQYSVKLGNFQFSSCLSDVDFSCIIGTASNANLFLNAPPSSLELYELDGSSETSPGHLMKGPRRTYLVCRSL